MAKARMTRNKEPRSVMFAEIERRFQLGGASYWFGDRWCPAVHRSDDGFGIRVVKSLTRSGIGSNFTFDYFYLDGDGLITTAPRGFARDYKPGRVVDIAAAVERFATPQADATRIGL
jgi:hypothetical protein